MYLTKPAGVFLQLLSLPFLLWAFIDLAQWDKTGIILHAGIALALLYLGGLPARRKK